jgi:hypothetical protein
VYACYAPNFVQPRPISTKQLMYTTDIWYMRLWLSCCNERSWKIIHMSWSFVWCLGYHSRHHHLFWTCDNVDLIDSRLNLKPYFATLNF